MKYLLLFSFFLLSLFYIDNSVSYIKGENILYEDSIYVFNEIGSTNYVVDNPNTRDIDIKLLLINIYSFMFFICLLIDKKSVKRYDKII